MRAVQNQSQLISEMELSIGRLEEDKAALVAARKKVHTRAHTHMRARTSEQKHARMHTILHAHAYLNAGEYKRTR